MSTPFLSIAIPVLNGEAYISEAIDSVIHQSNPDWELCISDNQSSDRTPNLCLAFTGDKRVKYSRTDGLLSSSDNWTRAVAMCTGEWVLIIGHDDLIEKDCLERFKQLASTFKDNGIVVSPPTIIDAQGNPQKQSPRFLKDYTEPTALSQSAFLDLLVEGMPCAPTGVFFRRELFLKHGGFSNDLRGCGDWEFLFRIASSSGVTIEPKPLSRYRVHPTQDVRSFVRGEHSDPELMQERMLRYEHLTMDQRRRMMSNMTMFLYRSVTQILISGKDNAEGVANHRAGVAKRISAWEQRPEIRMLMNQTAPSTFPTKLVWEICRSPTLVRLLRPLLRKVYAARRSC